MSITGISLPLLHGAAGQWDEVAIYGGFGLIILAMIALSWRASRRRKRRRDRGSPREDGSASAVGRLDP